jgi:hypothetical protein
MRKLILFSLFALLSCFVRGQNDTTAPNIEFVAGVTPIHRAALTAEIGGNGGIYSLNYHRKWFWLGKLPTFVSGGLMIHPRGTLITLGIPLSFNVMYETKKYNAWILGAGQTLILSTTKGGYVRGTFRAAYRWELPGVPLFLEFAYTPFYSYFYNFQWDNWVGIQLGWNITPRM